MHTVRRLADYVAGFSPGSVPAGARQAALRCLLDLLTAAVGGHGSPEGVAARAAAARLYAPGEAAVWFTGLRLQAAGAGLANSTMASVLDLDDGHRAACGHPGAGVIPAVLAVAEETGAGAEELLAAIVLGYEVGVRVAAARDLTALGAYSTGRWCGYGVVAGAGWLRRTRPDRLAHALAMAGVSAPNQFAAGSSGYSRLTGNSVKEGIPWATVTGLTALQLAEGGCTGPEDILDHLPHYDAAGILEGLGQGFLVEGTYFKPYSACRWAHAAIDGVGELMAAHGVAAGDLQAIEIHTFDRALRLKNDRNPATVLDAQYSLPYCVAVRAVLGPEALVPLTKEGLGRPEVVAVAEKVSLHLDPVLDRRFPRETPARVVLRTAAGRLERVVEAPTGEPSHPFSWEDLRAKCRTVGRGRMSPARQEGLLAAIDALAGGNPAPLREVLRSPLGVGAAD